MRFVFERKVVPYVRMTQKSKYVNKQAKAYLASKDKLQWDLKEQMKGQEMLPGQTPLNVFLNFIVPSHMHISDLDNQVKAVLDAMSKIVFPDDRWVDEITATRVLGKEYKTIVFVETID